MLAQNPISHHRISLKIKRMQCSLPSCALCNSRFILIERKTLFCCLIIQTLNKLITFSPKLQSVCISFLFQFTYDKHTRIYKRINWLNTYCCPNKNFNWILTHQLTNHVNNTAWYPTEKNRYCHNDNLYKQTCVRLFFGLCSCQ